MWKRIRNSRRFPGVKQYFYALTVLFSAMAWVFSVILVTSVFWRVWEFDSQVVPIAFIGLWKAQYYLRSNDSGLVRDMLIDSNIHSGWTHAVELEYAKDLIVLVNFMQPVTLIFCLVAFLVSTSKRTYSAFVRLYSRSSALLLLLNSVFVAVAVGWNYIMDISGQSTLDFPLEIPVNKEDVIKKHLSHVFPLGIVTAALSLLNAILCFWTMTFLRAKSVKV
ncbi:uncharacterized protein LOC100735516 [Cavia porcellus]|uniref:Uncharacterized protein n=1 Tax=Cavia porcellus TaxID=10141 RepID=A0A286XRH7_CAVPO|nr:uncharacterized protein LOC100735516 [Cavia porcellus]